MGSSDVLTINSGSVPRTRTCIKIFYNCRVEVDRLPGRVGAVLKRVDSGSTSPRQTQAMNNNNSFGGYGGVCRYVCPSGLLWHVGLGRVEILIKLIEETSGKDGRS